jgi:carbohydrate kinase (thermoresistant glucokinase family)
VLVFMGVSGSGKSTMARILAEHLGWTFEEGDALHSQSSIDKMKAGISLNDADRQQWIATIAEWVEGRLQSGTNGIITCSALKRSYRDVINRRGSGVMFVFLTGPKTTIAPRLVARQGHFMPSGLLDSQFADLEDPQSDEPHVKVDVGPPPGAIAQDIWRKLGLPGSSESLSCSRLKSK